VLHPFDLEDDEIGLLGEDDDTRSIVGGKGGRSRRKAIQLSC